MPRHRIESAISDGIRHVIRTGDLPDGVGMQHLDALCFRYQRGDDLTYEAAWQAVGDEELTWWVRDHPGTRPWLWWQVAAPELVKPASRTGQDWPAIRLRRRTGGIGTPDYEALNTVPYQAWGVPLRWVSQDPHDPPRYESQAAYLRRLELFVPGEARRLRDADFDDDVIRNGDKD